MSDKENDNPINPGDVWKSIHSPVRMSQVKSYREQRSKALLKPPKIIWSADPTWKPYERHDPSSLRAKLRAEEKEESYLDFYYHNPDHEADDFFMELVILEEPFVENELSLGDFAPATIFLAEDRNKEVCTFRVFGLPENENTREMFAVGARLLLKEPLVICKVNRGHRKEDCCVNMMEELESRDIYPIGRKVDMCRFCGKEKAKRQCAKCGFLYCDRKCQLADWKLKHELVCNVKAKNGAAAATLPAKTKAKPDPNPKTKPKPNDDPSKAPLNDPDRIARILNFREAANKILKSKSFTFPPLVNLKPVTGRIPPKIDPSVKHDTIYLKDMEYGKSYDGKVMELTIIDEPLFLGHLRAAHFMVEDVDKTVANLVVYGLSCCGRDRHGNDWIFDDLECGARIVVFDPTYKIGAADGMPLVRVDDVKKVAACGDKEDMCRYCGEEEAKLKCGKCKSAYYCGKKCQSQDLKILRHDLVCEKEQAPAQDLDLGMFLVLGALAGWQ